MSDEGKPLKQPTFPECIKKLLPEAASSLQGEQKGWVLRGEHCQVVFWETHKKGGYKFPRHSHTFDEYAIVLEGSGTRIVGDKVIPIREGDENYIPAGVEHETHVTSDVWRAVDFFADPDWVKVKK